MMEGPKKIPEGLSRKEPQVGDPPVVVNTWDDTLSFPTNEVDLSSKEAFEAALQEALEVAKGVIEKYTTPGVLFAEFSKEKRANAAVHYPNDKPLDDEFLKKEMELRLESQEKFAKLFKLEDFIRILLHHKRDPSHYHGITVLAAANALDEKLKEKGGTP